MLLRLSGRKAQNEIQWNRGRTCTMSSGRTNYLLAWMWVSLEKTNPTPGPCNVMAQATGLRPGPMGRGFEDEGQRRR